MGGSERYNAQRNVIPQHGRKSLKISRFLKTLPRAPGGGFRAPLMLPKAQGHSSNVRASISGRDPPGARSAVGGSLHSPARSLRSPTSRSLRSARQPPARSARHLPARPARHVPNSLRSLHPPLASPVIPLRVGCVAGVAFAAGRRLRALTRLRYGARRRRDGTATDVCCAPRL